MSYLPINKLSNRIKKLLEFRNDSEILRLFYLFLESQESDVTTYNNELESLVCAMNRLLIFKNARAFSTLENLQNPHNCKELMHCL